MGDGNYESRQRAARALANGPIVLTQAKFNIISGLGQLANVATKVGVFEGGLFVGDGVGELAGPTFQGAKATWRFTLRVGGWVGDHGPQIKAICVICSTALQPSANMTRDVIDPYLDGVKLLRNYEDIQSGIEASQAGKALQTDFPNP